MLRRSILISGISGLAAFSGLALAQSMSSSSAEKAMPYSRRPEVKKFIQDVCKRRGLDQNWVAAILDQATYQPKIERLMTPKRAKPGIERHPQGLGKIPQYLPWCPSPELRRPVLERQ